MSNSKRKFARRSLAFLLGASLGAAAASLHDPLDSEDVQGSLARAICEAEFESDTSRYPLKACAQVDEGFVRELAWEPSRGGLHDFLFGRALLVAATLPENAQRHDIYRLMIRLTPEGKLGWVSRLRNLTQTPLADEGAIAMGEHYFAFQTLTEGLPKSEVPGEKTNEELLTLFQMESSSNQELSLSGRLLHGLSSWLHFGDLQGLARADLFLPPQDASIEEVSDGLNLTLGEETFSLLPLFSGATPQEWEKASLRAQKAPQFLPPWHDVLADFARFYAGKTAVAWAEGRLFSLRDRLLGLTESRTEDFAEPDIPARSSLPARTEDAFLWPPKNISSPWPEPAPSEGVWKESGSDFLSLEADEAPLFYQTYLRPDPSRSRSELHLVAVDMRRLELGMRAGYEDPHPETGPPGSGHLPLANQEYRKVVATFNGAFKTTHGRYGMKAEGRVLVPPVEGAATIFVDHDGASRLGVYQSTDTPDAYREFRQNLEPLLSFGTLLPSGRENWGEHLYGASVAATRSGICGRADGIFIYAFSTRITARALARGMQMAGCVQGMHLDMNPGHAAFIYQRVSSLEPLVAEGAPLVAEMQSSPLRYVRWSPKDFFYLKRRSTKLRFGGLNWQPLPSRQPAPAYLPALLYSEDTLATLRFRIVSFDTTRLRFYLSPGRGEESVLHNENKNGLPHHDPLFELSLGHSTHGARTGLRVNQTRVVALSSKYANLVIDAEGRLSLLNPGSEHQDAPTLAQLPILARDGELTNEGKALGGVRRRSALCLLDDGKLLSGELEADSVAPLVTLLLRAGCSLVASADRGSHTRPQLRLASADGLTPIDALLAPATDLGAAGASGSIGENGAADESSAEGDFFAATRLGALAAELGSSFSVRGSD